MQVPYFRPKITEEMVGAVTDTLRGGWLTTGPAVAAFEEEFTRITGRQSLATNSATSAALLAFETLALKGGEVICSPLTFSSPAMMLHKLGAKVVLADVEPATGNLSPESVLNAITEDTRAILLTHYAGRPCNMFKFRQIAQKYGLFLIEDNAHALPAWYDGALIGNAPYVEASFYSFYANKTMTTGEGGMLSLRNQDDMAYARRIGLHGFSRDAYDRYTSNESKSWEYDVALPGWKTNMTDMAAALGRVQLGMLFDLYEERRTLAEFYTESLRGVAGLILPVSDDAMYRSSWHLYSVRVNDRDGFIAHMASRGVKCSVHFKALHRHSFWAQVVEGHFPVADAWSDTEVSLPIFPGMTTEERTWVVSSIKEYFSG